MSQIPKHRKVIRPTVIAKRTQCIKSYSEKKSYKPLCQKLKSNNSILAKALSKERQENHVLFSQNVALVAELQSLSVACNKRDAVISSTLENAKEILTMLVTMTGYITSTISSCQEFVTSSAVNSRMSCSSAGRRDSYRRQSAKSPTRGVVKPMVSGHTITKPTINLSRVNMEHINNQSRLSVIEEAATPPRNQEANNPRSPINVSIRTRRSENSRACRISERLTITSPRTNEENERRLSKKRSRHSGRISGKLSRPKSSRLSGPIASRRSVEYFECIGSPTVKLNDVSKILQNSQSINIRMLTENQSVQVNESPENRDSQTGVTIPETPPSDGTNDNDDDKNKTIKNKIEQTVNEELNITNRQMRRDSTNVQNFTSNWEDPLEGPSWLFNNSQSVPCESQKTDNDDDANDSIDDDMELTECNSIEISNISDNDRSSQRSSLLPMFSQHKSNVYNSKNNKQLMNADESTFIQQDENNETFCNTSTDSVAGANDSGHKVNNASTVNLANFVTQRRGCFQNDDEDDFTLMLTRKPRNIHFDLNDLRLPVLEDSVLKPIVPAEPEPEITNTLQKITQMCPIPSVSNHSLDQSTMNQSTVKLPVIINDDYDDNDIMFVRNKSEPYQRKKRAKKATITESINYVETTPTYNKNNIQKLNRSQFTDKDPSSVKVLLQKLNESNVKSRTPSPEQTVTRESNQVASPVSSLHADNLSDLENSSASTNSLYAINRPRRKLAPGSLHEPSLKKKLRRYK